MDPNQPGQMANPSAQSQQNLSAPYSRLLQPSNIQQLTFLSDTQKKEYHIGVTSLWAAIRENPQSSEKHQDAVNKLKQFTGRMMTMMKQGQGQAANAIQQNAPRPASQGQPMTQQQSQQGIPVSQAQSQSQPQTQQAQSMQTQQPKQQPQQNMQQPQRQQTGPTAENVDERYLNNAAKINIGAPASLQGKEAENFIAELRRRYAKALQTKDLMTVQLKRLTQMEAEAQKQGKPIADIATRKQQAQGQYSASVKFLEQIHMQQKEYQKTNVNNPNNGNPSQVAQQPNRPQPAVSQPQPPQNVQNNVSRQNLTPTTASPMSANPQQQQVQNMQAQQQPRPNMGAPQIQQPNFNIPRPMPNQASGSFTHGQHQSPQSGTPNQTVAQAGAVPAFNHQSALQAARTQHQPQGQQPQSAQGNATSTFQSQSRDLERQQNKPQFNTTAMKNWHPQPPTPVQMPPSRPTLGGSGNGVSGMISQPAIQQKPEYNLHGSGDRVLDKKKLDELVRQVAGAGDGADVQGLQPDVEESVLQCADEFIDNVVIQACRLAKARGATTLEVRDIQIILERYYNIRIPGFALDENRVVRKVAPAAPFLQKMNAVQAAKVMGGKTDV